MTSNVKLCSIFKDSKITGINFKDWHRNLRIVLKHEKIGYVLDTPIPPILVDDAPQKVIRI